LRRITLLKKLFIGNLPTDVSEQAVTAMCSEFGPVHSVRLATDRLTGKFRGFCLVEMDSQQAKAAIAALDGRRLGEKSLRVRFDDVRGPRGRRHR
jgi:RNA recognition motif-containing protein